MLGENFHNRLTYGGHVSHPLGVRSLPDRPGRKFDVIADRDNVIGANVGMD
jgi:hypothetical protein